MKKIYTISLLAVALAAGACANKKSADYTYETQAPYAEERTVGDQPAPVVEHSAERTFDKAQHK